MSRRIAVLGYLLAAGYLGYVVWHTPRCEKCRLRSGDREAPAE